MTASLPAFEDYFKASSFGKVQKKELGHFVVSWIHPRDQLIVDALLKHLESADKELDPLFRDQGGERKKVPIEIYPDLRSFSAVSGLSLARFRATGTIALTLEQRLMILSPRNLATGYPWAVTVVHEYVHYLIREISPDLIPIWLHEGVAQLFQGYPSRKDWEFEPSQWGLFKKAKQKKSWLNLDTLQEPFPYRKDPEEAELAYIEALIFVKWLNEKCGAVNLVRFVRDLKSIDGALAKCTGLDYSKLKQVFFPEVLSSLKIPDRADVHFFARDFSGKDPLEVEGRKLDKQARNFSTLSDRAFKQGRFRAAAIEMEKAFTSTPVHPPSWSRQLALSYEKTGKFDRARQTLEKLIEDYPNDAAAWFLFSNLKLKVNEVKPAWSALLRAFSVNPFMEGLEEKMAQMKERNPEFTYSFLEPSLEK